MELMATRSQPWAMQTTNQFLCQNSHCSSCNLSCQGNSIVVSTVPGMAPHSWPKSFNIGRMQISPFAATSFHRLRKSRARHMWLHLEPDWNLLWNQLCTEWPGIHTYDEINDRLFVNPGRNENILDVKSKVGRNSPEYAVDRAN